jgi:hypothetical protein
VTPVTRPPILRGLARRKSRVSGRPMSGRRHLRRASSEFLNPGGFLFDPFIGQLLRERYVLSQQVPQDMRRLLTQLDKPRTVVQTSQLRQRTGRAAKDNSKAP